MTVEELPLQREGREGWGMAHQSVAWVVYPQSPDDVVEAVRWARKHSTTIHCWGNGRSYGDAALNDGGLLLDFSRMNRILSWDKDTGIVTAQPGITLNACLLYTSDAADE